MSHIALTFLTFGLAFASSHARAQPFVIDDPREIKVPAQVKREACPFREILASYIYIVEGGERARVPYGLISLRHLVKTRAEARRLTLVSIDNAWRRWQDAGRPPGFISFMARKWIPVIDDPVGHKRWAANIRAYAARDHILIP